MKLFVVGHGQHGKGEVCTILRELYGLESVSSSWVIAAQVRVYLQIHNGLSYESVIECHADRRNHRQAWYAAIQAFNRGDLSRLSRHIFAKYDIYDGIRCADEYAASRHLADLAIWVDSPHGPVDPSCTIRRADCDFAIQNTGSVGDLRKKIEKLKLFN